MLSSAWAIIDVPAMKEMLTKGTSGNPPNNTRAGSSGYQPAPRPPVVRAVIDPSTDTPER